ncbi:LysM peptidoglycan-binding domain-containing protein [Orenia marismortui]|uniref:Type IV pilus assembly protein PilQ n=1 Tax=Orenia marismortui TaxID=46469 RepID=A0A4V3GWS5_9FIRM|nr:LysM peptidoglycan-binding domain-containing protein [Orenia marismortui]TDX45199.1 type IV pilus assembly protein PilQ [Orenia marismortui]
MFTVFIFNSTVYSFSDIDGLNINFKDMELTEAFRTLAEMTEINIATDSAIQGKTTLYLDDVSLIEALDVLTKTNNLGYKIINNTVFIAPNTKMQEIFENKKTKIYKLKNANPERIKANIDHLISDGIIKINERTNSLIITTYESNFSAIEQAISSLDYSKKQVSLQVRFEEISHSGLEDLGVKWELDNDGVGTTRDLANDSFKIGNLNFGYQVSLGALESSGVANVLANPKITTVEGEEAYINIGDEIPIVQVTEEEDSDGNTQTSKEVEFKNIGINLKITPKITADKKVFIKLEPEITNFIDWIEVEGTKYPETRVKKVSTKVEVRSGETIAIGGLIEETEYEDIAKLPLLGDVPILGKLFQRKTTETEKRELVIFITPQIIEDGVGGFSSEKKREIIPFSYQLERDQSYLELANLFNLFIDNIREYNPKITKNNLSAGQIVEIPIPKKRYYLVQKGDTIESITKKYKIKADIIKRINKIQDLSDHLGEHIILPIDVKIEDDSS